MGTDSPVVATVASMGLKSPLGGEQKDCFIEANTAEAQLG